MNPMHAEVAADRKEAENSKGDEILRRCHVT